MILRVPRRAVLAVPALLASPAAAQAPAGGWLPSRPVRIVVPFSAGGPTDLIARLAAAGAEAPLRQPVVVENRPGAGGSTGSALVARAAPDGHTLLVTANSHAINPAVLRSLPFDTLRDFAPAGTPPAAVATLNAALAGAMADPAVRERLLSQGIEPVGGTPGPFGDEVAAEVAMWAEVVRTAGIRPE